MKPFPNAYAQIISAIIFAVTIVAGAYLISTKDSYINNIGSVDAATGKAVNTISVTGNGKVYATPDMVVFTVGISETKPTSKEALDAVNTKVTQLREILTATGISNEDIQTTGLSIYTDYDWSANKREIIGQVATQSIEVKVKNIDATATQAAIVIDKVSEVDNVEISNIYFDIEDKKDFYTKAREEAFAKAEQKAQELADLGGVELLKPISISDASYDYQYQSKVYSNTAEFDAAVPTSASGTSIASGQMEIDLSLEVVWGIK